MPHDGFEGTATRVPLAELVGQVLADLAFLIADDEPPGAVAGAPRLCAEIGYEGPQRGTLRCWCSPAFARELAANLLGTDPDDESAAGSAADALCEFMNVLCGHLVTARHGHEAVFNLSIPKVIDPAPPAEGPAAAETCRVWSAGQPLCFVHEPAAPGA